MIKAQIITEWINAKTGYLAHLEQHLQQGDSCMDVTGQSAENITPDPNVVIWEVWGKDGNTTLDAIEACPQCGEILWTEYVEEPDGVA